MRTLSKSIAPDPPALIVAIRSSAPTMSAPAFLASSAAGPSAKTATFTFFPVPCGSAATPLT